ncbi:MAG: TonB-dependent receptor plug domain-containing protein [Pyrinomonadaceae bacterium]
MSIMRPTALTVTFLTFCFLLSASSLAAQDRRTLTGRVVDINGSPVAGAAVLLSNTDLRYERRTLTDLTGEFGFEGVAVGRYKISARAKTFDNFITDAVVTRDERLELTLQPKQIVEEVSVTASYLAGTPESLAEIPGSIERVDAQTLRNSRVFNFSEALRKVSGVNVRDEEGFGLRPNIGIRGTNPTRSSKVLLLEDGMPLSYAPYGDNASYYHPPVERYESIEVLKGSGQIAYGPQTIAGVINYLTPNPPDKPEVQLKLEGGNRSFFNGSAGFGTGFGRGGLLVNLNHKRGDGSRENTSFKLYDLATKVTYSINSRNLVTAKFSVYGEDSRLTYTGATEAEFAARPRGNIFKNDFFFGRRYGFSLQHAAVLTSNINLTTNFYSNYFSRDWWRQTSNSNERPFRLFRPTDPNNPISDADCLSLADLNTKCGNRGNLRDYLTLGIEPRLNVSFDLGEIKNELNIGFRVHAEDQERLAKYGDLPNSRDGRLIENNERKVLAYSGFIQNRFIWGHLALTPGVRIEKIEYERTNRLFAGGHGVTANTSLTEVVPGVGIAYSGLRKTTIFAGVHRGFAPPRVEDVVTDAGGLRDLDSERSWNYETGFRTRPVPGIELAGTVFRNDYENQIVAASIASGTQFTNGGKTLQQGIEFNGSIDTGAIFNSRHNFYARTAYTYLPTADFRGDRLSSVTSASTLNTYCPAARRFSSTACVIAGNRLPYTPKAQFTSSVGYAHSKGLNLFVENVYIGRQFADDLNAVNPTANAQLGAIASQTYWNATVNYKVESWKTTFFVTGKNLSDRTFIVDRSRGILPSQGRLVQGGLDVRF